MENHSTSTSAAAGSATAADSARQGSSLAPSATAPTPPPSDGDFHPLDTSELHESVDDNYQTAQIALDTALQRALAACHAAAESARSQHWVMWDNAMHELEHGVTGCQALESDVDTHKQQLDHFINSLQQACRFLLQPKSKIDRAIQEQ